MIKITLGPQYIQIEGHAGYDNIGKDIVCAAVSALGQTLKHIDELHREYEVNDDMLRVDFHDSLSLIQSYAIDRKEYLEEQIKFVGTTKEVRQEMQEELDNWEENCRSFAQMAKAKGLIIQNQVELIVKGLKEIAEEYPENVEVITVD